MPRIPESEITRIKKETDLLALVRSRGVDLKKHGSKDWVGCCPFHADKESPNFIVSPLKGLYHCMACGAAGNAIQFVEKFDGVSFRHAFELLNTGAVFESVPSGRIKQSTTQKLPSPLAADSSDGELMDQVADYYHERLLQDQGAREYLKSRGLDDEALLRKYKVGFADRTLGLRLPEKNRKEGKEIRERLQKLGIYRESGHEHFNGSIVFPIPNGNGHTREIYGRKITKKLRKGTPDHLYLPGPHHGIFNERALKSREIILCESVIDALTMIRHGMENATCIYGTQGFTDELLQAIRKANLDGVRLAYDADEAGEKAAWRDAETLQKFGIAVYRIKLPMKEDVNSFALNQGAEALKKVVRGAVWLGAGSSPDPTRAPSSNNKIAAELVAEETLEERRSEARAKGLERVAKKKEAVIGVAELVSVGEMHELALGDRIYRAGGLFKNAGLEAVKVTLRLRCGDLMHVDQVDLCKDGDRRRFCERGAEECRLEADLIKRDLGKLLLACERAQDARLNLCAETLQEEVTLSPEERAEAETLLKSKDLLHKLDESFEQAGIVGERTNRFAAYLTATSRLLAKPLAVIIQSTSAAGKTTLMEAVLAFFPAEEQVKYSAMTGQSLYYLGEKNLKHKILAIVEEEGAEKASYALKLLQSEGELTIASTGKDANTGRMTTEEYHVEGPVSIVLTTTSIDIDEELMNRCLILTVDESREQTERIHEIQRQARTLEGLRLKKKRKEVLTLLQNAQRLLKPMEVVNPFADQLTFTADRTRTRRDHEKYLTLIEAVTLLHQYQRPLEKDEIAGEHIKTTLADIVVANDLAPEVLGRSLDELPPQTRRLLGSIKELVMKEMEERECEQRHVHFTRRALREFTGWSQMQIRRHLERLMELEYVVMRGGRNGITNTYELLTDAQKDGGASHVGLLDLKKLKV